MKYILLTIFTGFFCKLSGYPAGESVIIAILAGIMYIGWEVATILQRWDAGFLAAKGRRPQWTII